MAIDREQIIEEALRLLDEVGLDQLTTRKLADRLGVKQPALYWHFANKQALIEAMNVAIGREHTYDAPRPGDDWQGFLLRNARSSRNALLSHRDGARVHSRSEADLGRLEAQLHLLLDAGFPLELALHALLSIGSLVLGGVMDEQSDTEVNRDWDKSARDAANTPLVAEALSIFRAGGREAAFETGVALLIEGLEARLKAIKAGRS